MSVLATIFYQLKAVQTAAEQGKPNIELALLSQIDT